MESFDACRRHFCCHASRGVRRSRSSAPARRIESLPAESLHEPLGVLRLREAVNVEPLLVVEDGMTTAAQTQVFAKLMNLFVAAAFAESRRQCHLMRSPAITARRRPLALPPRRQTAA